MRREADGHARARTSRWLLVALAGMGCAVGTAWAAPPAPWPPPAGARSPEALCRAFERDAREGAPDLRATCRVVCRARRGAVRAVVLRRGSGFHEGISVAIAERSAYRIAHDDVDDRDGVVIQGGAWGSLDVRRCAFTEEGALEVDVARQQTADPPRACDVTRDARRLVCRVGDGAPTCASSVLETPSTTRDPSRPCEP
jgi:hypothetical protein